MKTASMLASIAGLALAGAAMGQGIQTYGGAVTPAAGIPDNSPNGVSVTIDVPANGNDIIDDIFVGLIITHSWQGDLRATLTSPAGTTVVLFDRPGFSGTGFGFSTDNYGNPATGAPMYFDHLPSQGVYDTGNPNAGTGINNPAGFWAAEGNLTSFFGENKVGIWTLFVTDSAGGDTGGINFFELNLGKSPAPGAAALLGLGGLVAARRRRN